MSFSHRGGNEIDIDDIVYKYSVIKNICVILHSMKRLNQDMGLFTW